MKKPIPILLLATLLAGCNLASLREHFDKDQGRDVLAKAKFDRILIDSTGEMQVYASMNRVKTLSKSSYAVEQFADPFKEIYILVIKETAAGFKDALRDYRDQYVPYVKDSSSLIAIYGDFSALRLAKSIDNGRDSLVSAKTLNGMDYRAYMITGDYQRIPLFYVEGIYKSKTYLYQVVAWTMDSRRELYEGVLKKMVESVQETPAQ